MEEGVKRLELLEYLCDEVLFAWFEIFGVSYPLLEILGDEVAGKGVEFGSGAEANVDIFDRQDM